MRTLDPKRDAQLIDALNKVSAHLTKTFCTVGDKVEAISGDNLPLLAFAGPGTYVIFVQLNYDTFLPITGEKFGTYFGKRLAFEIPFEFLKWDSSIGETVVGHHNVAVFMDVYMKEGEVYFFEGGTAKDLPYVSI